MIDLLFGIYFIFRKTRDFPDSPVVKTLPSSAGDVGSTHGQGGKILHASWPRNQNIEQKQYFN